MFNCISSLGYFERMTAMGKKQDRLSTSLLKQLHTSGAGYDILRYVSLPNLLGNEADTILYFMGKDLARRFNITSFEDIYDIADKMGWGRLELVKEKKNSVTFCLMADAVVYRLKAPVEVEFRLECGFISEAVQMVKDINCECSEKINYRIHQVEFTVVYD